MLIAVGKLKIQVSTELEPGSFLEQSCKWHTLRRTFPATDGFIFEIADFIYPRSRREVVRTTIHYTAQQARVFGIEKMLQRRPTDNHGDMSCTAFKLLIARLRALHVTP